MDARGSNSGDEDGSSGKKLSNVLPLYGNERTMNLNPLILTNIQSSHYFKVNLYELKTYHEVVDEIYYKVNHLEPWEKGSRRTSGQTGMCGGVRGVGAGGIVSTAYCLLYKLYTLKMTRKQLNGLITHVDSPYIRALGFMYVRYVLPPSCLLEWYEEYLEDEEELDVKAGTGQIMKIGQMLRQWLVKLEWFSTLFPRIPVPIQQKIQKFLQERYPPQQAVHQPIQERAARDDTRRQGGDRERQPVREDVRRDFLREERNHFLRDDRNRSDDGRRDRDRYRDNHDRRGGDRKPKERSRSPNRNKHSSSSSSHSRDRSRDRGGEKYDRFRGGRDNRY